MAERKVDVDSFQNCKGKWLVRLTGTYKGDTVMTFNQAMLLRQDLERIMAELEETSDPT